MSHEPFHRAMYAWKWSNMVAFLTQKEWSVCVRDNTKVSVVYNLISEMTTFVYITSIVFCVVGYTTLLHMGGDSMKVWILGGKDH